MDSEYICPGCKKPLAQDAPQGLCPECLLKAGLGTGVDIGPDSRTESVHARFVAPPPEELAKAFPQLDILGFIGQGGMGAVYRARQKALDRIVAVKILPPGIGADPAFAERFAREAKALARLNHPGIVTLYEFGQADGLYYFLMEFVDGVNLRHLLEAGRLAPREALAIVPQICDALQYAHDQRIVHRDIKPENILLDRLGRVKVADFGLAKLIGSAEDSSATGAALTSIALTDAGRVMGTPQYMAPEQSETPATVDHRADIYALGVVLYQMLTGELPDKPIQPPSRKVHIDVRLDEVVLRALEKNPKLRYQHVSEVKTAVETIATSAAPGGSPTQAEVPQPFPKWLLFRIGLPKWSAKATPQPADWRMWSPFQSPRVREICAHMTEAEKNEATLRDAMFGVWSAATCFGPFFALQFMVNPAGRLIAPIVFLVGVVGIAIWPRMQRESLCATAWARQQAIQPAQLASGVVLVGRRDGKAVVRWSGVLLVFVLILAVSEAETIILLGGIDSRYMLLPLMFTLAFTGIGVLLGLRTPVEKLTPLGKSDGMGKSAPGDSQTNASGSTLPGTTQAMAERNALPEPRLSRTAIAGALCMVVLPIGIVLNQIVALNSAYLPHNRPLLWTIWIVCLALAGFGQVGVVASPILGWVAVGQIRRAAGRLYGLGLAVFDGLLFPLLALDGAIAWVWWTGIKFYVDFFLNTGNLTVAGNDNWRKLFDSLLVEHRSGVVVVLTLAIGGVLNVLIIRAAWRAVNKPLVASQRLT